MFQCSLRRFWLAAWKVESAGAHIVDTQGHISTYYTYQFGCTDSASVVWGTYRSPIYNIKA
jgi:hypothetical protein